MRRKKFSRLGQTIAQARRLSAIARRGRNRRAAKTAAHIEQAAMDLARQQRQVSQRAQQLRIDMSRLSNQLGWGGRPTAGDFGYRAPYLPGFPGGSGKGGGGGRGYTVGLIGQRAKRGTVDMIGGGRTATTSTAALTHAFQKLLSAFSDLAQLKVDIQRVRQGK